MDELIEAIAVSAEISGTRMSEGAAMVMAQDLAEYPLAQVLEALRKFRLNGRGRMTVAEILSRIDDGRPGVEEAWAMLPFDESKTVVWTKEMSMAWGVVLPLIEEGDRVGARMAFKEAYSRELSAARDRREVPKWSASLGHDPHGRDGSLLAAVEKGRLELSYIRPLLSAPAPEAERSKLGFKHVADVIQLLASP